MEKYREGFRQRVTARSCGCASNGPQRLVRSLIMIMVLLIGTRVAHADPILQEKGSWIFLADLKCKMGTIKDHIISIEYSPVGGLSIGAVNKSWKMAEHTIVQPVFVQLVTRGSRSWVFPKIWSTTTGNLAFCVCTWVFP